MFNASEEIAKAAAFPQVRLFTAALKSSDTPEEELLSVEQQWAVAGPGKIILFNHPSEKSVVQTPPSLVRPPH